MIILTDLCNSQLLQIKNKLQEAIEGMNTYKNWGFFSYAVQSSTQLRLSGIWRGLKHTSKVNNSNKKWRVSPADVAVSC